MAQNVNTVTNPNPTPPTNMASIGATPPNPATFDPQIYVNTGTGLDGTGDLHYPRPSLAPVFDDGVTNTYPVISQNEGGGVNGSTAPSLVGSQVAFTTNHAAVAVGGTTVAHEGAGTEVVNTAAVPNPSPAGQLRTVSTLGNYTTGPNGQHASSLSPATNPALASISPTSTVSGGGTQALTCTGTNFTKQSVIYVNGVAQTTTFVSATSLTATVTKKATAGTWPVVVITAGTVTTAPQTWTFT